MVPNAFMIIIQNIYNLVFFTMILWLYPQIVNPCPFWPHCLITLFQAYWLDQHDDDLDPWSSTVQNYVENMKMTARAAIASVKKKIESNPELTDQQQS